MLCRLAPLVLALALSACAHDLWISDRLFFGRSIPGGGVVSDAEWSAFVAEVVTPRFPDGLTIYAAKGQWREADRKIVGEDVAVIEILHPASDAAERAIGEIQRAYRERFRQEAVMRVKGKARVTFAQGM
jgi:hypothetical protein